MKKLLITAALAFLSILPTNSAEKIISNDSHVHLTDYIMKGPSLSDFLKIMNQNGIKRCAIFGIPLQLEWNMDMEDTRPTYYLNTDGRLYYYSAIDTMIAREYLGLSYQDQKRFDPMLCGFNPADGGAVDHIERMISMYPGVFCGLGEFSIHKEAVTGRVYGKSVTVKDPALGEILKLSGKIGLVVNIHCDTDAIAPDKNLNGKPRYFKGLFSLFKTYPKTTIIWAHTGLGRFVKASQSHKEQLRQVFDKCPNVYMDISWSAVAEQITKDEEALKSWAELIKQYPDRFLFGTDSVSPSKEGYAKDIHMYDDLWKLLPSDVQMMVRVKNHDRIFDMASEKVREWEKANLKILVPKLNWPFEKQREHLNATEKQKKAN